MESLTGRQIELPLLSHLGAIRSHVAQRIPWHSHASYELLFVLEGATAYEFQRDRKVDVPGGHWLVVPPRQVHRGLHNVRMPSTLCGIAIQPNISGARTHTPFTAHDLRQIMDVLRRTAGQARPASSDLRRQLARLWRELSLFDPARPLACASLRSLVCAILVEAIRQLDAPTVARPDELIKRACAYLEANAAQPVRMNELAQHLGLGRARMFSLFKSVTGLTPNDYLQRHRVASACRLLQQGRMSITGAALEAGFPSSQYFSCVFKRYTGQTPRNFRKANLST